MHHAVETARVVSAARERFLLSIPTAGEFYAALSGHLRHTATLWPATGDWVTVRDRATIEDVHPRRTAIVRKRAGTSFGEQVLAANVDTVLIVTGLDHDYNPRRLERYLVLAAESGAQPVVVLNKVDLHASVAAFVDETSRLCPDVVPISARTGEGVDGLESRLTPGQTSALIGSSGAGKSTLLNRLLGRSHMRTGEVRESDHRGRHTTTHRELLTLPNGAFVIDMPGLRELQLWADPESVGEAFAEIEELAQQCRYRDCQHQGEPGCAVEGHVDSARLASYRKLQREVAHLERQQDLNASLLEKRKWKAIHKAHRNIDKRS
ncbi:putative ribosome biogenesis GTPase RsgA [Bryobacterales bacterium F-183]|nr:putative ribosome biogenesis GTPase RsgA [Bryobacterales bacterium F-183]